MAIAYRHHTSSNLTTTDGSPWSVTLTKPTGLTAGDYMVAVIATVDTNAAIQAVANWTTLASKQSGNSKTLVAYGKSADAGDVAASDFTFAPHSGNGGTNDYISGVLIAFSGTSPTSGTIFTDSDEDTDNGSATQNYAGGVSILSADNALVLASLAGGVLTTTSGYAIATDNPSWTERLDTNADDTEDYTFGVATATRAAATATGAYQATFGTGTPASVGLLIAVVEVTGASVSPSVITMTASVIAPAVAAGATVSPSVVTMTASVQAPTVTTAANDWSNTSKSSAPTWTNTSKS